MNNQERKSVHFSDVIRYSDKRIRYLEYEADDIVSNCTKNEKSNEEKQRWNMETKISAVSADSPPLPSRRRSSVESLVSLATNISKTSRSWFDLTSGESDVNSSPAMPERQLSRDDAGKISMETQSDSRNARWESIKGVVSLATSLSRHSSSKSLLGQPKTSGASDTRYSSPSMPKRKISADNVGKNSKGNVANSSNSRWESVENLVSLAASSISKTSKNWFAEPTMPKRKLSKTDADNIPMDELSEYGNSRWKYDKSQQRSMRGTKAMKLFERELLASSRRRGKDGT